MGAEPLHQVFYVDSSRSVTQGSSLEMQPHSPPSTPQTSQWNLHLNELVDSWHTQDKIRDASWCGLWPDYFFFPCKTTESKYFGFYRQCSVCWSFSALTSIWKDSHRQQLKRLCGCPSMKLHLWVLKLNFLSFYISQSIALVFLWPCKIWLLSCHRP